MRKKRHLQPVARLFAASMMLATMSLAQAQTKTAGNEQMVEVTGTVQDETGTPLVRANVQVTLGKQRWPATTNESGYFSIKVPANAAAYARISASYIGLRRHELGLQKGKTSYTLVLQDDSNEFAEAVVTGYGTVTLREKTSSITSLKMDDVLMPGMTSLEQALEGRVPDLVFMQNSGEAGSTARLRVRGTSTLVGNREPLWVLDGIPLSDPVDVTNDQLNDPDYINYIGNAISGLNPQDIERVDVLKDAAATALYGTRAANGVIVVTTKKGDMGPPRFSYNGQYKYTSRLRYTDSNINLMNSKERVAFGQDLADLHYSFPDNMTMVGFEGAYYRYLTGVFSYEQYLNEVKRAEVVNTDWFKLLTNDTFNHNHTLSVSGGGQTARYYASLGYNKENGTVRGHDNDRYTASINLQTKIANILTANIRFNASVQKRKQLPGNIDALGYAYNTTRALPSHNADGSLYYYQRHAYNVGTDKNSTYKYRYNILNEMQNSEQTYEANNMMAALDLTYRYKNLLDVTFTTSYQRTSSNTSVWYGERTNYVAQLKNGEVEATPLPGDYGLSDLPYGGVLDITNNVNSSFLARLQANLRHSWGERKMHQASASFGYEVNTSNTDGYSERTRGYFRSRGMKYVSMTRDELKDFPHYASWLASNRPTLTADRTNRLSGYAIFSYSYGNIFSISANGRFDASNKFGSRSNEKFLPVWSLSTMVNLKELLLPHTKWVNDVRLRSSFGKTGNMVDGQTPNLLLKQGSIDTYYGQNFSTVAFLPNPNLRWEQTDQLNVGVDGSFFDYRLTIGLEAYYKHTHDAFSDVPVSTTNGVNKYMMNSSDIRNTGFSIQLSGYPIQTRDWSWYLSTNYSFVHNKVETKAENDYQLTDYLNGTAIINGQSIGTFYAYNLLGLNEKGLPVFDDYSDRRHLLEGKTLREIMDMVLVNVGSREPNLNGSVYSTLRYKQWSLRTNFVYSIGNKIRKFALYRDIINGVSSENNVRKEFVDRWRVPGDEHRTLYPALISPSSPDWNEYRRHWSSFASLGNHGFKPFAENHWSMYDQANVRVVSGDYVRLSQLALSYQFRDKQLKKWGLPISNASVDLAITNVFTIKSSKLKDQDPTQSGFSVNTALSLRPAYTLNLRLTF